MAAIGQQLSFSINPRPASNGEPAEVIDGELKISGALSLAADLEHGDELIVTVTGPDGEVLARSHAKVSAPPTFLPIEVRDVGLVGYSRVHAAKLGDPIGQDLA